MKYVKRQYLIDIRERLGMSRRAFAKALLNDMMYYQYIEAGRGSPGREIIFAHRVAKLCGCDYLDIIKLEYDYKFQKNFDTNKKK